MAQPGTPMTRPSLPPVRLRQVLDAADRALELEPGERTAFVERCCAEDPSLGAELKALLASAEFATPLDGTAAAYVEPLLIAGPPLDALPAAASRIGSYRILGQIGRGGMGAVYLAERADDQYRKHVAVKLLPTFSASDEQPVRRFLEERQILAALEHPDIARLLDGGVTPEGLPWFAMEYVEGAPIDRYCDDHCLTIEQRLELFRRVCAAVQYAHRNLVVHRDLKPANILVSNDGRVKLLDFGIAKLLGGDGAGGPPAVTLTDERLMTPRYASPEQVTGGAVSTASDVYALGVLLHELLTGRDPYRLPSEQSFEVVQAILEREPERASVSASRAAADYDPAVVARARGTTSVRLRRHLMGDLDMILLTALQKHPARRYGSVEQLQADLERHLTGLPIAARGDGRLYRARKFVRRNTVGVVVAAIFALVVVGFVGLTSVQAVRIRAEARHAREDRTGAEAVRGFLLAVARNA